jgi:putative FmdB family regulatory protein
MPIYEYECIDCGGHVEALQRFSDKPLKKCKSCSGKLQRLISQSSFHLKGTGWYVTDYADKSKKSSDPAKSSSSVSEKETKKESKTVSKKSEE